jgi:hypothetical protein
MGGRSLSTPNRASRESLDQLVAEALRDDKKGCKQPLPSAAARK